MKQLQGTKIQKILTKNQIIMETINRPLEKFNKEIVKIIELVDVLSGDELKRLIEAHVETLTVQAYFEGQRDGINLSTNLNNQKR